MARAHKDFVIGFIAQRRMDGLASDGPPDEDEDFLILTPGVSLDAKGDALGQQYRGPKEVVGDMGCDVIIVGRGVYGKSDALDAEDVKQQADRYRLEGWAAYEARRSSTW